MMMKKNKVLLMQQQTRCLFLGRKAMTVLDSMLKSRDNSANKGPYNQGYMVLPVAMYGCDRQTLKKAARRRIDAFKLWYWRRLLRVTWTPRRANLSILSEVSPEYCLEGLMLKLKLQYFPHLMQTAGSFEKSLMLGKIEGRRRRGHQRMRWLDGITSAMDLNSDQLWETVRNREAWFAAIHGVEKSQTQLGKSMDGSHMWSKSSQIQKSKYGTIPCR